MTEPDSTDAPQQDQQSAPDKDWTAEAEKWKALARKHEGAAKANADAASRLAKIEESSQTELEKAVSTARKETEQTVRTQMLADRALDRIEVLARDFADPEDARLHLSSRASDFIGTDGNIDSAAIKTALAELLSARPHLAAQATGRPVGNADQGAASRQQPGGEFNGNDFLRQLAGR